MVDLVFQIAAANICISLEIPQSDEDDENDTEKDIVETKQAADHSRADLTTTLASDATKQRRRRKPAEANGEAETDVRNNLLQLIDLRD